MKKYILILFLFSLASCSDDNSTSAISGTTDRESKEIVITVNFVNTQGELRKLYSELTNTSNNAVPDQYGFAQWNEIADGSEPLSYNCQIYALRPTRVDDNQILTLGHELAHCIYGTYHK